MKKPSQQISGFVHSVGNVTDRKRSAEAIPASEEFNRAVLASLTNYVAILDRNGDILAVNDAWKQFAHQNRSPLLPDLSPGDNYLEVCQRSTEVHPDFAGQVFSGILSVLDGEMETFSIEYPCGLDPQPRWFAMTVMPFKSPNGGAVISHTDITKRKIAEMEAQLHREELAHITRLVTIEELAGSLAHEINQPMTAILCNAEAALRFLSSPTPDLNEVRTIIEDIIQDDKRAGEMIRRMRTLVKRETSRHEKLRINDILRESIAVVRNASSIGGITITTDLDPELPPVRGDRMQLQQVILNLLLNAIYAMKGTPSASRSLVIGTARQDGLGIVVAVSDSGVGLDNSDMERMFEPFYTTKEEGLGMGLAISRTIIKAHRGTIWAENNPEGGATFHFTLPLDRGEPP